MEKYRLLFESVFKQKLTTANAVSELEKIAAEHPYFSIAQFYLLQLTTPGTAAYKAQAQKTTALFNNNYWLNFQLLEAGNNNEPVVLPNTENKEMLVENSVALVEPATTTPAIEEQQNIETNTHPDKTGIESSHTAATVYADQQSKEKENFAVLNTKQAAEEKIEAAVLTEEPSVIENSSLEIENAPEVDEPSIETPGVSTAVEDASIEKETSTESVEENKEETLAEAVLIEIPAAESEAVPKKEIAAPTNETTIPEIKEKLISPAINITGPLPDNTGDSLLFEPLHTSDYFASMGIKLSEEEKTADKLGKQLKSFTDWLKTMKKVHAQQAAATAKPSKPASMEASRADSSIQKLAEKSNQENEVLTEAMADVLLQQDRKDKAVEILEKLSLLNPGKSAYFAAKINQIKEK